MTKPKEVIHCPYSQQYVYREEELVSRRMRDNRHEITDELIRLHKKIARLPRNQRSDNMWKLSAYLTEAMARFDDELHEDEQIRLKYEAAKKHGT